MKKEIKRVWVGEGNRKERKRNFLTLFYTGNIIPRIKNNDDQKIDNKKIYYKTRNNYNFFFK